MSLKLVVDNDKGFVCDKVDEDVKSTIENAFDEWIDTQGGVPTKVQIDFVEENAPSEVDQLCERIRKQTASLRAWRLKQEARSKRTIWHS